MGEYSSSLFIFYELFIHKLTIFNFIIHQIICYQHEGKIYKNLISFTFISFLFNQTLVQHLKDIRLYELMVL